MNIKNIHKNRNFIHFFCLSSVRFSGTNSVEIDKILPSAGATSMLSFFGVTRSGSLKKYTHQIVRITPIHPRKFERVEKIIVQIMNRIIKGYHPMYWRDNAF